MENTTTTVQQDAEVKGKTILSFTAPTPKWATWVFRAEFGLNKAALMVMGATKFMTPEQVKEAIIWMAAVDFLFWFMARGLGVKKEDFEQ